MLSQILRKFGNLEKFTKGLLYLMKMDNIYLKISLLFYVHSTEYTCCPIPLINENLSDGVLQEDPFERDLAK